MDREQSGGAVRYRAVKRNDLRVRLLKKAAPGLAMSTMSNVAISEIVDKAESNLISTTPGAVPPHFDDGGHLPFGGTIGNTRGPSAFGKRKMTRANAIGNPQALLLNYPPENTESTLRCWERNYKSSIYEDPTAEGERLLTTNWTHGLQGKPTKPSYLADHNQTWGNMRQTAFTRPSPSPAFYPPARDATEEQIAAASYSWQWPKLEKRPAPPQIKRYARPEASAVAWPYILAPLAALCITACAHPARGSHRSQARKARAKLPRGVRSAAALAQVLSSSLRGRCGENRACVQSACSLPACLLAQQQSGARHSCVRGPSMGRDLCATRVAERLTCDESGQREINSV